MAQMSTSLAKAILNGAGVTRHELEQLARHWLASHADELHPLLMYRGEYERFKGHLGDTQTVVLIPPKVPTPDRGAPSEGEAS